MKRNSIKRLFSTSYEKRFSRRGVASAAAAGLALIVIPVAHAQSTLDMPLDTGASSRPAAADTAAPAVRAGGEPRLRVTSSALASRGMATREGLRRPEFAPPAAPQVLAQLATVTANSIAIRLQRDRNARTLSVVREGTNLAVVADGGNWWGVLMVNNTMGWLPKSALRMMDYQTQIAVPSAPTSLSDLPTRQAFGQTASRASAYAASGSAYAASNNFDARTTGLLREAFSYLGVPYVWAGNTRNGLDCSAFLCNVYAGALGIRLPRHSGDQARIGQTVSGDDLRPGDRLYFDMGNKGAISHCGIYLGNGYFIHASTNHGHVDVDSLMKPNYRRALVAVRRDS